MEPSVLLAEYGAKSPRLLVGLMSGTSADAVTAAAVRLSGCVPDVSVEVAVSLQHPLPKSLRAAALAPDELRTPEIARLNMHFGEVFAEAALAVMQVVAEKPDAIASHGQTLAHQPEDGATLQVGEPSAIVERTGVLTVAEFRYRDMAAGGQGAPLVPLADYALFGHSSPTRAVQNIGGIANVTYLPAGGSLDDVIAFDTGPGNMVIDGVVQRLSRGELQMDVDGRLAAEGSADERGLAELLDHPFLSYPPPKTTGREDFGGDYAEVLAQLCPPSASLADLAATATAFAARSIAHAYRTHLPALPDEMIVGGGGAKNPTLMGMLRESLPEVRVLTHEEMGISDVAKEAVAFCILANETLLGRPGNVPSATGARRAVPLGKVIFP